MKHSLGLLLLAVFCLPVNAQAKSDENPPSGQGRYIRLIALANPLSGGEWMPTRKRGLTKDYTAQDILEMIKELKPDCLERFITGYQDQDRQVPVREGCPPMTVLEFLNEAMMAGGPGCFIIPKLNLEWLKRNDGGKFFWDCARQLYEMPLVRPIRNINLDCWDKYCDEVGKTESERNEMFEKLRKIGYEKIGVNLTGRTNTNNSNIDYADFNINKDTWEVPFPTLKKIQGYSNVKEIFLYIDYPRPMTYFVEMTADKQADVYSKNIYPFQEQSGFTFVYPIIQDFWDASDYVTSPSGEYKGKTMYEITKMLLDKNHSE